MQSLSEAVEKVIGLTSQTVAIPRGAETWLRGQPERYQFNFRQPSGFKLDFARRALFNKCQDYDKATYIAMRGDRWISGSEGGRERTLGGAVFNGFRKPT